MPGKGKPFAKGDPRQKPGPGRPKMEYLAVVRYLCDEYAQKIIRRILSQTHPKYFALQVQVIQDLLNRGNGKPKETLELDTPKSSLMVVGAAVWARFVKDRPEWADNEKKLMQMRLDQIGHVDTMFVSQGEMLDEREGSDKPR